MMRQAGSAGLTGVSVTVDGRVRVRQAISKQATRAEPVSARLEWSIDHFDKLMKLFRNGQSLVSKQFSCPEQAGNVVWELHVYPNGKREEDNQNVSFFLRQVGLQRGEESIMTEFQIYASDRLGARVSVCRDIKDFTHQQGRGKFQVSRDKMTAALKEDGTLQLICEVEFFPPGWKVSVESAGPSGSDQSASETLVDQIDIRPLFDEQLLTDCCITVENRTLKVHRCILALHSEVFRSMFQTESMVEAKDGVIDITDARYEAVRGMVEYMYCGRTDELEGGAQELLAVADKYAIHGLKSRCERRLAESLTRRSVCDAALFADTYNAGHLRAACLRFIARNRADVLAGTEWEALKRGRRDLACQLLENMLICPASSDGDASTSLKRNIAADEDAGSESVALLAAGVGRASAATGDTAPFGSAASSSAGRHHPPRKRARRGAKS